MASDLRASSQYNDHDCHAISHPRLMSLDFDDEHHMISDTPYFSAISTSS